MVLKSIIVFSFFLRSIYTDLKEDRIENGIIISGYVMAVIFAYISSGVSGIVRSGIAAAVVMIGLFPLYMVKGLGAGDIKLLSMTAAFFPQNIIEIVILSFLTGGFIILLLMIIRWIQKIPIYKKNEIIHFSIPIAVGTWISLIYNMLQEGL